jgi:hypothetical protein
MLPYLLPAKYNKRQKYARRRAIGFYKKHTLKTLNGIVNHPDKRHWDKEDELTHEKGLNGFQALFLPKMKNL